MKHLKNENVIPIWNPVTPTQNLLENFQRHKPFCTIFTKFKFLKKIRFLLIMTFLLLLYSLAGAQKFKSKFEISLIGIYCYHLNEQDLAIAPDREHTHYNLEFRLAYYYNTLKFVGFYTSFNFGWGTIIRGISNYYLYENSRDNSKHQVLALGITLNPMHSKRLWFRVAGGFNRLKINGVSDMDVGYAQGVIWVGNDPWTKYLNNLPTNGNGTITGYPAFTRVAPIMVIGITLRPIGPLTLYFDYTPVFTKPIRNDFSGGISFVFP